MPALTTIEDLEALYGQPGPASTLKALDRLNAEYRAVIAASPFAALATVGPEGLDCSPRGDAGEVVRIADDKTLLMPDRRGNNRADSLRNIVRDPRVALLFLIPGSGSTLRVNGRAELRTDQDLLQAFRMEGKPPRCVMVITIDTVFFQCARAVIRADLWNPARHVDVSRLPSAGRMLSAASQGAQGGDAYDAEWPARAAASLW
ncbi:MAG: pyridoxamine 5'-phosphate oxidase family protein [Phenylobacterium sp.]|uniref:pyridoxamine 5'-phosphate oxidase family protein n=1 Tax=Phenylobacterium sp. TaxID=1871053 RepID=UPI00271F70ED|nr:pyridoxamine 5'-phosphate oxidase family protein [Phenylobacterium sp.]MDO8914106.1 pyridoxamine 5'-phosphate oxidase family protein [Phenylobacterium sp.]MDP2009154.1 pyridoxamine 5'-phosphate oxidase family protein [Phenylobacterium sp.]MDP3101107.1 pyridoxamine 5'-phosphate oxidase family protein [Phenylobacterium sp.]